MIFFLIWIIGLILATLGSAYCSARVNQGAGHYWFGVIGAGLAMSFLWLFLSKHSVSMIRDSLLWDVIYVVVFTLVLIYFGYGNKYEVKHWIGVGMTTGVFFYWILIK